MSGRVYVYLIIILLHTKHTSLGIVVSKKVQVGKDQEKAQSEKIPYPKTEVGIKQLTIRY